MASQVDPIEIKVNIGGNVDHALGQLGLDPGAGQEREIWFLDDITEGLREALPLLNSGVILRLRRPEKDSKDKEDSTVKLRPCRRSQLVGMWNAPRKHDPEYRIEGDWSRKRHVVAASCVAEFAHGTFERALKPAGALSGAFSEPQRTFLAQCSDILFAFEGLTALGPITATQWKDFTFGDVEDVTAERWRFREWMYSNCRSVSRPEPKRRPRSRTSWRTSCSTTTSSSTRARIPRPIGR